MNLLKFIIVLVIVIVIMNIMIMSVIYFIKEKKLWRD